MRTVEHSTNQDYAASPENATEKPQKPPEQTKESPPQAEPEPLDPALEGQEDLLEQHRT